MTDTPGQERAKAQERVNQQAFAYEPAAIEYSKKGFETLTYLVVREEFRSD